MKIKLTKFIDKIRDVIPLKLRIKIGPFIAYCFYIFNIYFNKNRKIPIVLSIDETINKIINDNLSLIRFGDGEMSLIDNQNLSFQKTNPELVEKLKKVIQNDNLNLLICIPGIWKKINNFSGTAFWFALHHLFRYGEKWKSLLNLDKIYGDAFITRPYLTFKDKSKSNQIFYKLFSIWENKDIVLIEGEKSRNGVGNDMFSKVKSIQRILCPSENAFDKYYLILKESLKIDKNKLILISLGPTAKVLAYDLFLNGYRVIDIGHIDMEYEMFIRKETSIQKVQYKYFNEINERNPENCQDPDYLKKIITTIK